MVCTSCSGGTSDTATTFVDAGNSPAAGATNCLSSQACRIEKPALTTALAHTLQVWAGGRWAYFGHNGNEIGLSPKLTAGAKWRIQNFSSYCTLQTLMQLDSQSSYLSFAGNKLQAVPAAKTTSEHWVVSGMS